MISTVNLSQQRHRPSKTLPFFGIHVYLDLCISFKGRWQRLLHIPCESPFIDEKWNADRLDGLWDVGCGRRRWLKRSVVESTRKLLYERLRMEMSTCELLFHANSGVFSQVDFPGDWSPMANCLNHIFRDAQRSIKGSSISTGRLTTKGAV